jgi:RNA polymerase sigma factor (TIGR02999 family)
MSDEYSGLTVLLQQASRGDDAARADLFRVVQQKLHAMAERKLIGESNQVTMQATVLVHDAFLQLIDSKEPVDWNDRKHFYVVAAKAMRHILVDHARRRNAVKRGGPDRKRSGDDVGQIADRNASMQQDVLAIHDALKRLAEFDSRQAEIVELRHFGGYTVEETADLLGISARTVKGDFAAAKAWLFRELSPV